MDYDLIVIGGGPAGYCAAERAGHAGLSTLLVEERALGGVCLNEGCIPTKTLLHSAKLLEYAQNGGKYGISAENVRFDHARVMARKDKIVKSLVAGVRAKLKAAQVTVVEAAAEIRGRSAAGYVIKAGDSEYTGRRLLIATGSLPAQPPIAGLAEGLQRGFVLTNREILALATVPATLAVIGGGVIGLEMAAYFQAAGSQVTVIEMLDHIAGETDRGISTLLQRHYEKKGVVFMLSARVTAVADNGVAVTAGGQEQFVPAEKVLLSSGRRPLVQGYGLENLGVVVERGAIATDSSGLTNLPGVYAAGDVNGRSLLAHTAYREAEVCVQNMLGRKDTMRYHAIPAVIYTNPEVASVGETEESTAARGLDAQTVTISMRYSGRYMVENEGGDGICKLVVDKKHQTLLGVHMIGNPASEIIYGAALMLETEMRLQDIKEIVFPHPTVAEIIREAVFSL